MSSDRGVEVELKFRVDDPQRIRDVARTLGGRPEPPIRQIDTYFAHPTRDFAKTDEALRVRIVGETGCVTYKGPLLDAETKSREETELWFAGGTADATRFGAVLERLAFRPVRAVKKHREPWSLDWRGREAEIALDEVEELGTFVELETASSPDDFAAAKAALLALAECLGLHGSERRSYLALLLERDGDRSS
jgi:adenylate cyclase class 2